MRNPKFDKMLDKKLDKGLLFSAEFLKKEIKKKVSRTGGASSPGQPPNKQTGDLQKSIRIDATGLSAKRVKIGSDEDYSVYLEAGTAEMAARPFLRSTYRENKKGIIKSFNKGMNR